MRLELTLKGADAKRALARRLEGVGRVLYVQTAGLHPRTFSWRGRWRAVGDVELVGERFAPCRVLVLANTGSGCRIDIILIGIHCLKLQADLNRYAGS